MAKQQVPRDAVDGDRCPHCDGELDTGWECLNCGYDALWIAALSGAQTEQ